MLTSVHLYPQHKFYSAKNIISTKNMIKDKLAIYQKSSSSLLSMVVTPLNMLNSSYNHTKYTENA